MKMRAGLLFFAGYAAFGQQPPEAVFHATTKLVQLSVIARDAQGKPVADLRREEFQLFDNGAAQEVRLFSADAEKSDATPSNAPRQEAKTRNTFTNRIASGGGSRGGYSVLLFDNNNTGFEHTARARIKALQALQTIPPEDKIAIYSLWCQFQVVREFTSDRESLLRQLNGFAPAAGGCGSGSGGGGDDLLRDNPRAAEAVARITALQSDTIGDEEIKQMADHLAGIPGRKNLIWLATSFRLGPAALHRLIDAGVTVYPVDAYGSMIGTAAAKEAHSAPLRALAAATGGVAFYDRDDLDGAVREAIDDGRISYTLGFYEAGDDKSPKVHQLSVRVTRPGVTLRYRTSYETAPQKPASANPVADLVQAMNRPVDSTAILIKASATRVQDGLNLTAKVDVAGLDLELDQGLWKGKAEFLARFTTAEGAVIGEILSQTATFNLRPATYASMSEGGVPFHAKLRVPLKAVELKLLVGNLATGKIGTLTIPLPQIQEGGPDAE
jgi:VWFA-related protein